MSISESKYKHKVNTNTKQLQTFEIYHEVTKTKYDVVNRN